MKPSILIIVCTILAICNGHPLKNPVRLTTLKSDFDELEECFCNQGASFDLYTGFSAKLHFEENKHYVDITGGTIDLTNIYDETKTIKGTPLRYKNNKFFINENYKKQLKDFENYKITSFNPTESGANHVLDYFGTEEFHQSVQIAISNIKADEKNVLDLNIYQINLEVLVPRPRRIKAFYNKDINSVIITSPFKVLISDYIPQSGEILPNPVLKHGLVYDIKSKLFKERYPLQDTDTFTTIPVYKFRPYPFCEERQQEASKFWKKDRSLEISSSLLNTLAIEAIPMSGTSLINFRNNIQLTLNCNPTKTTCNLHGSFTIDGDDVQEIVSDKNKKFTYKSSSTRNRKDLLQSHHILLHPLNREEINNISNLKTEMKIEYIRISELRIPMLRFYSYFEAACQSAWPPFSLHFIINYRRINIEYKCKGKYFTILKEPSLCVALYNDNTLTEILDVNNLEYNIRYSPHHDVFATRTSIINGMYGFKVEDHSIEFRDEDIDSDLIELAHYFDEIRTSLSVLKNAKHLPTLIVMRIGKDEIFVAKLDSRVDLSKSADPILLTQPSGVMPMGVGMKVTGRTVIQIEGNFILKAAVNGDDKHFTTLSYDGKGFLSKDARGNLMVDPATYIEDTRSIRIRLAETSLLGTKLERKVKNEIFYARISDLQKIANHITVKIEDDYCQNDHAGLYSVDIKMRKNRDFIVTGKYSCRLKYFSIEIKPNTKIFTMDGKGLVVSEQLMVVFTYGCVSITTRNYDFKDIYAFRVKEYSVEHEQTTYEPGGKPDICTEWTDEFEYSCFVKRENIHPLISRFFPV